MSTGKKLISAVLLAIFILEPAAVFLRPAPPIGAAPLRDQVGEPVIMYATMMTKVNISFVDNEGKLAGPTSSGNWSGTPTRMPVTVVEVPGASKITGYRLVFKEGYKRPSSSGLVLPAGSQVQLEPVKSIDLGMSFAGGGNSYEMDIKYVSLPPSAFQPQGPAYSAVGEGQSGGSGGSASQAGSEDGGGIALNPYVNVPQWGNAAIFKIPEFLMPHFTMPGFKLPDFSLPKFQTPEYQNPKFTMPAFALPEFKMPQFDMPTFSMPSFSNFGSGSVGGSAAAGASAAASAIPVADLRPHKDFIRNLEGAEAYNVPVRVYLSGKVDTGWPIVQSFTAVGCVKGPEGGKLEMEDLDVAYSPVPPVVKQEIKSGWTVTTYEGASRLKPDKDGLFRLNFGDSAGSTNRTLRFGLGRDTFTLKRGIRHDPRQPESEYTLVLNPTNPPLLRVWAEPDLAYPSPGAMRVSATIIRPKEGARLEGQVRFTTTSGYFSGEGGGPGNKEYIAPLRGGVDIQTVQTNLVPTGPGTAIVTAEYGEARASIEIALRSATPPAPVYADWPPAQAGLLYSTYVDSHCTGESVAIAASPNVGGGAGTGGGSGSGAGLSPTIAVTSSSDRFDWPAGSLTIEAEYTDKYGQKGLGWGKKLSVRAVTGDVTEAQIGGYGLVTVGAEDLPKDFPGTKIVFQIERQPNAVRFLVDGREAPVPTALADFLLNPRPSRVTFWVEVATSVEVIRSNVIRVTVDGGGAGTSGGAGGGSGSSALPTSTPTPPAQGSQYWTTAEGSPSSPASTPTPIKPLMVLSGLQPVEKPFERLIHVYEDVGKWATRSKALEPEGTRLLAEFRGMEESSAKLMPALLNVVIKFLEGVEQQYGTVQLTTLAANMASWESEVDARMKTFVDARDARIKELYAVASPVLKKYGFEGLKTDAAAERLFQSLSPAQRDEVRLALKPLVDFTNNILEEFKKANNDLVAENENLQKRALEAVNALNEPIEKFIADFGKLNAKGQVDALAKRLNALSARLERYAPEMKTLAEIEDSILKKIEALESDIKDMNPSDIEKMNTLPSERTKLIQVLETYRRIIDSNRESAKSAIISVRGSGIEMDKTLDALRGQKATEENKKAFLANLGTPPLDLTPLWEVLRKLETQLQEMPTSNVPEMQKLMFQRQKLLELISNLLKASHDVHRAPVLNLRANILRPVAMAAERAAEAQTLAENVFTYTNNLAARSIYLSGQYSVMASLPTLAVSLASPATVLVTDDRGRRAGYDPARKKIVLEIPGATYSGPESSPQLVLVPLPLGQYKVAVNGTGAGEYHLGIARISGEKTEAQLFVATTAPGQQDSYGVAAPIEQPLVVQPPAGLVKGSAPATVAQAGSGSVTGEGTQPAPAIVQKEEAGPRPNWPLWAGVGGAVAVVVLVLMLAVKRRVMKR